MGKKRHKGQLVTLPAMKGSEVREFLDTGAVGMAYMVEAALYDEDAGRRREAVWLVHDLMALLDAGAALADGQTVELVEDRHALYGDAYSRARELTRILEIDPDEDEGPPVLVRRARAAIVERLSSTLVTLNRIQDQHRGVQA